MIVFKEEDIDYKTKWSEYHRKNATLRVLCENCNLSRSKKEKNDTKTI